MAWCGLCEVILVEAHEEQYGRKMFRAGQAWEVD